jgi:hypothetical protein
MKGNFHVRFLEGGGLATARSHSAIKAPEKPFRPPVLLPGVEIWSIITPPTVYEIS